MNEIVLKAGYNGKTIYEEKGDKSLVDILNKRLDPKKKYSDRVIKIFNDLNTLSGIPKHKSSGKANLIRGGLMLFYNPGELTDRSIILSGSMKAGNSSCSLKTKHLEL